MSKCQVECKKSWIVTLETLNPKTSNMLVGEVKVVEILRWHVLPISIAHTLVDLAAPTLNKDFHMCVAGGLQTLLQLRHNTNNTKEATNSSNEIQLDYRVHQTHLG